MQFSSLRKKRLVSHLSLLFRNEERFEFTASPQQRFGQKCDSPDVENRYPHYINMFLPVLGYLL